MLSGSYHCVQYCSECCKIFSCHGGVDEDSATAVWSLTSWQMDRLHLLVSQYDVIPQMSLIFLWVLLMAEINQYSILNPHVYVAHLSGMTTSTKFYWFCESLPQNYLRSWTWRNVLKLKCPSLSSQFTNLLQKQ